MLTSRKALVLNKPSYRRGLQQIPGSADGAGSGGIAGSSKAGALGSGFFVPAGKTRRVLGIDPGLASTGYGIVDFCNNRYRLVHYGVISTEAGTPHGERLLKIYSRLTALVEEFLPQEAAMETLYFAKNVSSAMSVAEARGVVTLCLAQHCIPLGEYTPNNIKQAVTGLGSSGKAGVQEFVRLLLGMETLPKPDHAADALAAAITHVNSSR
ncbi:MAG: crossover junction endodeoxyribonuclease RuvC [Spirochaetaceae bacterium]|nr:crossover junction endodeoxyribonuclease RuvC [Spirochaetaceae bacterium]